MADRDAAETRSEPVGTIQTVVMDVDDIKKAAEFWAELLGGTITMDNHPYMSVRPPEGGISVLLQKVPEPKTVKNRAHIDVYVDDLETAVPRAEALGARQLDDMSSHGTRYVVFADPDGNEFCLVMRL